MTIFSSLHLVSWQLHLPFLLALGAGVWFFFQWSSTGAHFLLAYTGILCGLYFGKAIPYAAAVINGVMVVLLIMFSSAPSYPGGWGLLLFLLVTPFIPLYFGMCRDRTHINFMNSYEPQVEVLQKLEKQLYELEKEHMLLDKEIGGITGLYVLGRELVEHLDINDVAENMQRILLNRPGINSVALFLHDKNAFTPVHISQKQYKDKWQAYIHMHQRRIIERQFRVLPTPAWLDREAVVYWPVWLEQDLLAAIFLTVNPDMVAQYLLEGQIFIPQIALGIKRTMLFAEVQERSRIDGLTGLYLRRYFLERFGVEVQRARRYSSTFSVFMLDLDHFKQVNDKYGHLVGDEVLKGVASLMRNILPPGSLLGRYGGEEFIVLIPLIVPLDAMKYAAKIKETLQEHVFTAGKVTFSVTTSMGVSHYPLDGKNVQELLECADKSLYWVKTHGRNGIKENVERFPLA